LKVQLPGRKGFRIKWLRGLAPFVRLDRYLVDLEVVWVAIGP